MNKLTQVAKMLFSKQGRINRLQFLLPNVILIAIIIIFSALFGETNSSYVSGKHAWAMNFDWIFNVESLYDLIGFILIISSIISLYIIAAKRLHDFNASGWWLLVGTLFPPLLFILWIMMLVRPGTKDMNDFDVVV